MDEHGIEEFSDGEFSTEFASRMGVDTYELTKFLSNRSLSDTIKLDSFILNSQKFTIEQFETFIKSLGK